MCATSEQQTGRPRTRAECRKGKRPCPWVSCRYHLYLDVNRDTGTIKFNFPDKEIWELEFTCALDLAEEGELTFEQIGRVLNLTRERIRQLTTDIVDKMYEEMFPAEARFAQLPLLECSMEAE